jgi:antitoxin (DNA-binding transcriptional repressor) of toxin-antitoxin stability system
MESIAVNEFKARVLETIKRVEAGETIILTRDNIAVAELRPLKVNPIKLGVFEGEFEIPESAFLPLTNEEMKVWYGE